MSDNVCYQVFVSSRLTLRLVVQVQSLLLDQQLKPLTLPLLRMLAIALVVVAVVAVVVMRMLTAVCLQRRHCIIPSFLLK